MGGRYADAFIELGAWCSAACVSLLSLSIGGGYGTWVGSSCGWSEFSLSQGFSRDRRSRRGLKGGSPNKPTLSHLILILISALTAKATMDNDHGGPPLGGDGAHPPLPANPEDGYTPYPVHYAHYHHAAHHQGTPQMQMQPQQHSWNYPPQPHVMYQFPPSHQQHTQHMHYHQQSPPPREDGLALDGKFPSTAQHQKFHQQHEIEIDKIDPVPVNVMQHHSQSETQQQQQQEQQQNSQEPVREIQTTPATTAAAGVTNDETQLQPTKYDSFEEK